MIRTLTMKIPNNHSFALILLKAFAAASPGTIAMESRAKNMNPPVMAMINNPEIFFELIICLYEL